MFPYFISFFNQMTLYRKYAWAFRNICRKKSLWHYMKCFFSDFFKMFNNWAIKIYKK